MDEYYTCTRDVGSAWHRHWPEFLYRSVTYISWLSDFALYLEDYMLDKYHNWGPGRIFKGTGIECIYLKGYGLLLKKLNGILGIQRFLDFEDTCWKCYMILGILFKIISGSHNWGILVPCDAKIYHIKCMWVSDLHFMVQWFCFTCWRLFDGLILFWRYWFSVTQTLNWNYMYFVGHWPIFHGPVILPYILKTT